MPPLRRIATALGRSRQDRLGSHGVSDCLGAVAVGRVVVVATGQGYSQRTRSSAASAGDLARTVADRRRCVLSGLRAVPSAPAGADVVLGTVVVAGQSVYRGANSADAFSRWTGVLLARQDSRRRPAAHPGPTAARARPQGRRLA